MFTKLVVIVISITSGLAMNDSNDESNSESRMYNGKLADIIEVPYTVFIKSQEFEVCTGAIVSRWNVLTAAHCVQGDIKSIKILSGSTMNNINYTLHLAQNVTRHENFTIDDNKERSSFDIAVIRVDKPFNYSKTTRCIKLTKSGEKMKTNARGKISGWGMNQRGRYDNHLTTLILNVVDEKSCNKTYERWGGLMPGQFCAKNINSKRFPCYGDSGAPLVVDGSLAGINIYGGGCEMKLSPSVFSDVAYFRDWINKLVDFDDAPC